MWKLRNNTNEQQQQKRDRQNSRLLKTENKLVVTRGEVSGGMGEVGEGD